jgi:hypothetical protein
MEAALAGLGGVFIGIAASVASEFTRSANNYEPSRLRAVTVKTLIVTAASYAFAVGDYNSLSPQAFALTTSLAASGVTLELLSLARSDSSIVAYNAPVTPKPLEKIPTYSTAI